MAFSIGLPIGIFLRLAAVSLDLFAIALIVVCGITVIVTVVLCIFVTDDLVGSALHIRQAWQSVSPFPISLRMLPPMDLI